VGVPIGGVEMDNTATILILFATIILIAVLMCVLSYYLGRINEILRRFKNTTDKIEKTKK
jgi:membrane protein DedA with SNARE-associated domain